MSMIDLDEKSLLAQFRSAKDLEIEHLLDQYGSSLKEVREMYPQLTGAIKQRQLTTAFPTQPLFFTASEAAQMGLGLQEGWMLKMTPTEGNGGYTSSFITPEKWEIKEGDIYVSPTGEQYSRADIEALLSTPTGGLAEGIPTTAQPLTIENLTEEGKRLYGEYQQAGGGLDVNRWLQEREQQQLETEQIFGKVFPEQDLQELIDYINTNPEGFLADIREIGWTPDTEALLRNIIPEVTEADLQDIFGTTASYIPESWWKDAWDALVSGAVDFIQGLKMRFTSIFPSVVESLAPKLAKVITMPIQAPIGGWAYIAGKLEGKTEEEAKEALGVVPQTSEELTSWLTDTFMPNLQEKAEQNFLRLVAENKAWEQEHPELIPKPEYLESPFEHPELFKDPGYIAYTIANSLAYSLTVMGTMIAVSAVATPVGGITAGMIMAGGPEAASMTEELMRQGVSFEEAAQWGELYGLIAGGVEVVSDLPFLGLIFKPIKAAVKPMWDTIFRTTANRLVKSILAGLVITQTEALEEVVTQAVHNAILKHYDETQSITEGMSQAYIQAVIATLPFAAIGGGASYRTFRSNLSEETGGKYDAAIEKWQKAGLTEEQAQVQAANELAMTPEGEAELSKAIEVAKEEYLEEHPVTPVTPELADKLLDEMRIAGEVAKKVTPEIKEPWQMTLAEYQTHGKPNYGDLVTDGEYAGYLRGTGGIGSNRVIIEDKLTNQKHYTSIDKVKLIRRMGTGSAISDVNYDVFHKNIVRQALSEGKPVPAEVLADYPDLAKALPKAEAVPMVEGETIALTQEEFRALSPEAKIAYNQKLDEIKNKANRAFELRQKASMPKRIGTQEAADMIAEAESIEASLREQGVEIVDHTGEPYNSGMALRVIGRQGKGNTIIETLKPTVRARDSQGGWHILQAGDVVVGDKSLIKAAPGMPEAGLQPSMLAEVPAKEVTPQPTGKLVQARMDDYLRLRDYNKQATIDRIAEIKKALETKGRTALGLRGNLKLELARLEAQQELDAVKSLQDLDDLIREVETELGRRSLPGQGEPARSGIALARHPRKPNMFPEYTSRQLEEMLKVYNQARQTMQPEVPTISPVKAEDIPTDIPALTNTALTPNQIQRTIDLFKEAVAAPNADMQRAAAIELRKHVLIQRATLASESAQAMIAEGMNPEEAIRTAEQQFMTGKLPDVTTDYFDDLTQEMRNVLFAKVYNYWKDKSWFELISSFDALTNALAGRSIPRIKGIGTKYFPAGGSAWDRLARVFIGDMEILEALDKGKSLSKIIEGVFLQTGRGSVPLSQETVNWLKELSTISEEDKLLLTKPLSELTETDVKRIAEGWFWKRKTELDTLLTDGVISKEEYKLELAIAKDRVFPYKPISPAVSYPGEIIGQPRLGEKYVPLGIEETRTERELRLAREAMEATKGLGEAGLKGEKQPIFVSYSGDMFNQLPLLTLREKGMIVRTLKSIGWSVIDIGNFLRANKASCDMSYWRQIKTLIPGNPAAFYRSNVEAWKSLFSQASAEANWEWVKRQPSFPYYAEMVQRTGQDFLRMLEAPKGTAQWQAAEEFGYLTEERAIPRFTAKVPWIKWSGRAFVSGTNTMTILVYNKCLEATLRRAEMIATGKIKLAEGEALSIQQEMDDYGKAIAWMTQRASLGKAKALAPEIGSLFFAPRSKLGRFLTPKLLIDSNPRVRAFAWKNLSLFVGVTASFVMLGYWLGLWDVERDPRNAEFMSIRIGNLRIDPWAGNRQFLVLFVRLITGTGVSSVTGQEYEVNPIGALTSFFRTSLAPLTGGILDFWTGKNFLGEEVDIANPKQWVDRIAPFTAQDLLEAFQDSWQHGLMAILPAIFGEGVQTYTGDWAQNWAKIGLPKYPENTGYGIYEPVYDLADFWADVDPAGITEAKGFPPYVRSIVEALQIIDQIETLPNKRLASLNADPEQGTTFMQYYQMWQERQKIVASGDKDALTAFDADERTRNAYLGNITQAQYALLVEYNSLPDSQKADFLGRHPELYINPREDWLRSHPAENALLALWDKANIYSLEALARVQSLSKSLDIPESALILEELDAVTQLKLKNKAQSDLLDAYSGLDDEFKGPDGLTARDRAIKELYADNPDFRDDIRRVEALNVGTEANPTPEEIVEGWVERGQIVDEFGPSSAETKLWLIDNREVHQWALENGLLTATGEDWNEPLLRLEVQYRDEFDKYEAYGRAGSPSYIANDTARADAREAMLFGTQGMTSFGKAYYTKQALQKGINESLVTTYVGYYGIRKKEGVDYSAGWYEDDWYLMEHPEFEQAMVELYKTSNGAHGWKEMGDYSKVPTREVYKLYQTYNTLPKTGDSRLNFRHEHPNLDDWLVLAKGLTPVGDRWTTTDPALANRKYWLDEASHYVDLLKNLGIRETITAEELTDYQAQRIEDAIRALRGF